MKRGNKNSSNKFDKWLLLNWKKLLLIVAAWFLAVFLHNVVYGLGIYFFGENVWGPGGDEAFFFIIAIFVIPFYFIVSLIYTIVRFVKKSKLN